MIMMSRELNKDLFAPPVSSTSRDPQSSNQELEQINTVIKHLSLEMAKVQKQIFEVRGQTSSLDRRLSDLAQGTRKGFERLQGTYQNIEKFVKGNAQEIMAKVSTLTGKVTERRVQDTKIQELVDRQNLLMQNFEVKINQLQKLINEQEIKLLGYQSLVKDLEKRLKR